MSKIGIQGGEGSYHELAAHQLYPEAKLNYQETFSDLFDALRRGKIDSAIVAIANNRVQFIPEPFEVLTEGKNEFEIIGETYLQVEHALLAPKGANLGNILDVHSQAPAIGQCRNFLATNLPNAQIVEEHDTAGSAKLVSELNDKTKAAIASTRAGELYGLEVIKAAIQDDPANITRFFEIRLKGSDSGVKSADKTTILLKMKERPGALHDALGPFKKHDINLSNLHSRIIPNTAFDMVFFLEFEAGTQNKTAQKVFEELEAMGDEYFILGSYKSADIPVSQANVIEKESGPLWLRRN